MSRASGVILFIMETINQKELARKYNHLKGKYMECFCGRITTPYKMILNDVSLVQQVNVHGIFAGVLAKIEGTSFNGKALQLNLRVKHVGYLMSLKVPVQEIDNLTIHENE